MTHSKGTSSKTGFNKDDRVEFRKHFFDVKSTVEELIEEINNLKLELKTTKNNFRVIKKEKKILTQTLNFAPYKIDDLEQYGRQKNIRIHGIKNLNLFKMMVK